MRKILLAVALTLALASPAFAWNEKGHLVICRIAWLQMTDQQRATATAILKKHPHYDEYLTKSKPDGFTMEEWAFMRAGPWADWVRSGSARSYGHSTWHYINYPVCFPGMGESEEKHQPPAGQENAVWAMNRCLDKIKNGTDEEMAVYLTWLCHLVGDIHQPLHCVALYSSKYPDSDRGGNAIRIRISSSPTNLHSFWDGLLGRGSTAGSIGKDIEEIKRAMMAREATLGPAFRNHTTPESWAREGAELTRNAVYIDGELLKAPDDGQGVLQAPAEYARACGKVARVQIGKAGARLATELAALAYVEKKREQEKNINMIKKLGGDALVDHQRPFPNRPNASNIFDNPRDLEAFYVVVGINLRNSKISDKDLYLLKKFPELEHLTLANTVITSAGLVHIRNLKKLRFLDCRGCDIDDFGLENVAELTEMRVLYLDETNITDGGLVHLRNMTKLGWCLSLAHTSITDAGLKQLESLRKLRCIDLVDTKVTAAGVRELRNILPDATVIDEAGVGKKD